MWPFWHAKPTNSFIWKDLVMHQNIISNNNELLTIFDEFLGNPGGQNVVKIQVGRIHEMIEAQLGTRCETLHWIWQNQFSLRSKLFLWKLYTNALPMKANIGAVCHIIDDKCPRCNQSRENLWHVFLHCLESIKLWEQLLLNQVHAVL